MSAQPVGGSDDIWIV